MAPMMTPQDAPAMGTLLPKQPVNVFDLQVVTAYLGSSSAPRSVQKAQSHGGCRQAEDDVEGVGQSFWMSSMLIAQFIGFEYPW